MRLVGALFAEGFFSAEDVMVVLSETVGLVADGLAESEALVSAVESDWFLFLLDVDEFFFFGE